MGNYQLSPTHPYLLYLPHCSKALYESLLTNNFSPLLAGYYGRVLLGNDLADYLPNFSRKDGKMDGAYPTEEFIKPKKKRKEKGHFDDRQPKDGVLQRLGPLLSHFRHWAHPHTVPHMSYIPLSVLPETNLPGFARAFLSLAFQWLPVEKVSDIDWETPLPEVEWPQDGEMLA